jgi:phosphatidylglycerophosphate synthase
MADPATPRPAHPTIAQLRAVTQPESVRGRRNAEHWTADAYLRRISPYLTRVLLRTPLSANGITGLMILTGASAAFALLIPGLPGAVLAALLGQMQMLWDCCDGEVARWRETYSPAGIFLDKVGHYTAEGLIPIALGIRATGWPEQPMEPSWYPFVGALAAVLVLYNKALNDMVHVSRAFNGLPRLADKAEVAAPRTGGLRRIRSAARFVPFHRAYHSVEMTLLALVAAVVDTATGGLGATRVLVVALAALGLVTVVGHVVAILTSSRLR